MHYLRVMSIGFSAVALTGLTGIALGQTSCDLSLDGRGELSTQRGGVVGGNRSMEQDFRLGFEPMLVNRTPVLFEAIDFAGLGGRAAATKDTHRLSLQTSILPASFGDSAASGRSPVTMQLRSERTGGTAFGAAQLTAAPDLQGPISAINAFAQRYLNIRPSGVLAFVELSGSLSEGARDPGFIYIHVVERVGHLAGAGTICSDTFGLTADLALRVYTMPRPATE